VIAISAPFDRRGGEPIAFTRRDRAEQIEPIVDLRRAVDLLRARADVDDDRIAYLGISYGAAMGGLLPRVEQRLVAFVLMSGDGGLVEHFSRPEDRSGPLSMLSSARRKAWLAAMRPIEPLTWVKRASAPLLFLSGRGDQLVPPRDAKRYQRAAHSRKRSAGTTRTISCLHRHGAMRRISSASREVSQVAGIHTAIDRVVAAVPIVCAHGHMLTRRKLLTGT
jgi:dienelactone hydrolase